MVSPVPEIVNIACLPETQHTTAVELVRLGFEDFYQLFGADTGSLNAAIARQFANKTELENGLAATESGQLTGIACAYPRNEMAARQAVAIKLLLEVAPNRQATFLALRNFSGHFPTPAPAGLYVSRVGVPPQRRRHGIAGLLLRELEQNALSMRQPHIQLHVRCDNQTARSFYAEHGYREEDGGLHAGTNSYLLLYKKL